MGGMELLPRPFSREAEQGKSLLPLFLNLSHVKVLNFTLEVRSGMGRAFSPSQNNNGFTPLYTVYTFRDENLFRINLKARHTKAVKAEDS